jgi:hypothetical protein
LSVAHRCTHYVVPERIEAAAIMTEDGEVFSIQRPGRHGDIIRSMCRDFGCDPGQVARGRQGFITDRSRFVGREMAFLIAVDSGQMIGNHVDHRLVKIPELFSEDIW